MARYLLTVVDTCVWMFHVMFVGIRCSTQNMLADGGMMMTCWREHLMFCLKPNSLRGFEGSDDDVFFLTRPWRFGDSGMVVMWITSGDSWSSRIWSLPMFWSLSGVQKTSVWY